VPLPDHDNPENRGINWPAVARILLIQMLVLIALAGAFVTYVDWSSEQALFESIGASEVSVLAPYRQPPTRASIQADKGPASCGASKPSMAGTAASGSDAVLRTAVPAMTFE
jgi:hypothetical protein